MNFTQLQRKLTSLTNRNIKQTQIASALCLSRSTVSIRAKRNSELSSKELDKICKYFGVSSLDCEHAIVKIPCNLKMCLDVDYRMSTCEKYFYFDHEFLLHKNIAPCDFQALEIVKIAGNSASPVFLPDDCVLLNKNSKEFKDGLIFAFELNGKNYIRETNLLNDKVKFISLNKNYDDFVDFAKNAQIFGEVVSSLRL